jgi:hypothetical protein
MYIQSSFNLVDGNDIYNATGFGIQIYKTSGTNGINCSYNIVRNNKIHDTGSGNSGLLFAQGDGNLAYDNVLWNNNRGIQVAYGASNTQVYNNTIYHSTGEAGIWNGHKGASNSIFRNNILYHNTNNDNILDEGTATMMDHNLVGGVNPLFVNVAANDFHLQAGSPAINAGTMVALVPVDLDGIPRPQGNGYDIGALEYY